MNVCLPVERPDGLNSLIFPNFRATPALLIVDDTHARISVLDTSSGVCGAIPDDIDVLIIAGGIGPGMFHGLQRRGVRVFVTQAASVAEALAHWAAGRLPEIGEMPPCHGHSTRSDGTADHSGCACTGHSSASGESLHGSCGCHH